MSFTPPPETIGERVRRLRRREGFTVEELAKRAGVAKATISNVEASDSAREDTLVRIAKVFGAPVGWLRDGR